VGTLLKIKIFIKNNVKSSRLAAVCVIVVITIIGVYLLYPSHATGPYTTAEAETGVYAGGASPASSTSASGGSYIKYASGSSSGIVDSSTIANKFMLGFQGWFQCPTDGSPNAAWLHWFSGTPPTGPLTDFWPDVSELTLAEKCDTGLKLPNGSPAYLFSDYNAQTVLRQFQWMQQYNIDGVMLQRFASELSDPRFLAERNQVTQNVMNAANSTGRTFDIMYDISGQSESTLVSTIENDWTSLVNTQNVTKNAHYLHQNGKPIVVLWGFGFSGRPGTPADLTALLNFFHKNSNPALDATVMGGVDNNWRS